MAEIEIVAVWTYQGGGLRAITWKLFREETANSILCCKLLQLISARMPDRREDWPMELLGYF